MIKEDADLATIQRCILYIYWKTGTALKSLLPPTGIVADPHSFIADPDQGKNVSAELDPDP